MAERLTLRDQTTARLRTLLRSVSRIGWPRTDKDRAAVMISSLFLHIHPARVSSTVSVRRIRSASV